MADQKKDKARKPRKKERSDTVAGDGRPTILLVGDAERSKRVKKRLKDLRIELQTLGWNGDAILSVDDSVAAAIIVEPLTGITTRTAVRFLRRSNHTKDTAIMVLVAGKSTGVMARALYETGATAVFEWPSEASTLSRVMAERLGIVLARGKSTRSDVALARTVRAYLRALDRGAGRVKTEVAKGVAYLRGPVTTYWRKEQIEEAVRLVPGVKAVAARGVYVEPSGLSDRQIKGSIKSVLDATSSTDTSGLIASVSSGAVLLTGTAESRAEAARIASLVSHVNGVRSIDNRVVVETDRKASASSAVRRLRKIAANIAPRAKLDIQVFAGAAVLNGRVGDAQTRWRIERAVFEDDAVDRVINKIEVPGRRKKGR
jgi:osmotically-inducible protein OsmY